MPLVDARQAAELQTAFERAFRSADDPPAWATGWLLAEDLGAAAVPLLLATLQRESRPHVRLCLVPALALADGSADGNAAGASAGATAGASAGGAAERELLQGLASARRGQQALTLLALATTTTPLDGTAIARIATAPSREEREEIVQVAALVALSRARSGRAIAPLAYPEDGPGALAAALLVHPPPRDVRLQRWFDGDAAEPPSPEAGLVWRALFLADGPAAAGATSSPAASVYAQRLPRAVRLLGSAGNAADHVAARQAAAVFLARAAGLPKDLERPPPECVALMALRPDVRRELWSRGWLEPVPPELAASVVRQRLAVAFALAAPWRFVADRAGAIAADEALREPVAFALAWRAYRGDRAEPATASALAKDLTGAAPRDGVGAAAQWLRLAHGLEPAPSPDATTTEPPSPTTAAASLAQEVLARAQRRLSRAFALAREGRLPAAAAAAVLEDHMWARGWHPGVGWRQVWLELVRDLLLSGSRYARAKLGLRQEYLPRGFHPESPWFEVAVEFWRFQAVPRRPVPAELRLELTR